MRSAWVRALHESPEDAESLCFAQEDCQKAAAAPHTAREPALPTAGCARAGRRSPVPRLRAPQLSSVDLRLPSHRRERQAEQLSWHGLHRQHAAGLSTYASSYQHIASGARAQKGGRSNGPGRLEQLLDTKGPAPAIAGSEERIYDRKNAADERRGERRWEGRRREGRRRLQADAPGSAPGRPPRPAVPPPRHPRSPRAVPARGRRPGSGAARGGGASSLKTRRLRDNLGGARRTSATVGADPDGPFRAVFRGTA